MRRVNVVDVDAGGDAAHGVLPRGHRPTGENIRFMPCV